MGRGIKITESEILRPDLTDLGGETFKSQPDPCRPVGPFREFRKIHPEISSTRAPHLLQRKHQVIPVIQNELAGLGSLEPARSRADKGDRDRIHADDHIHPDIHPDPALTHIDPPAEGMSFCLFISRIARAFDKEIVLKINAVPFTAQVIAGGLVDLRVKGVPCHEHTRKGASLHGGRRAVKKRPVLLLLPIRDPDAPARLYTDLDRIRVLFLGEYKCSEQSLLKGEEHDAACPQIRTLAVRVIIKALSEILDPKTSGAEISRVVTTILEIDWTTFRIPRSFRDSRKNTRRSSKDSISRSATRIDPPRKARSYTEETIMPPGSFPKYSASSPKCHSFFEGT